MKQAVFALFAVGACAFSVPAAAQGLPSDVASLQGLSDVHVAIGDLGPELDKKITRDELYSDVGRVLLEGGIQIIREETFLERPEAGLVFVVVQTVPINDVNVVYNVGVELRQTITLLRDPDVVAEAETWTRHEMGIMDLVDISQLRDRIREMAQALVADHAMANGG